MHYLEERERAVTEKRAGFSSYVDRRSLLQVNDRRRVPRQIAVVNGYRSRCIRDTPTL